MCAKVVTIGLPCNFPCRFLLEGFRTWPKQGLFDYSSWHIAAHRKRFADRWIVITGATSGIGLSLAEQLIEAGAKVYLIARREEILRALCEKARQRGGEALWFAADLRDPEALTRLIADCQERLPHVDYLFCNAGKSIHRTLVDSQDRLHDFDRTMNLNYRAMVALTLALYPHLQRAHQEYRTGRMIYSSSVSTLYPAAPGWSAYHSSKAAANVWCETADAEWAKDGVRVKVAYLPLVHTPMSDVNPQYRHMPGLSAEKAARIVLRLSQSRWRSYKPWWARLSAPVAMLMAPLVRFVYRRL